MTSPRAKRLTIGAVALAGMVLVVLGLGFVEQRVGARVLRYEAEGIPVMVQVTRLSGDSVKPIAHFTLEVDGVRHESAAAVDRPPPRPGEVVVGRHLPGEPLEVRLKPANAAAAHAETEPFRGMRWILLLTAAFVGAAVIAPQQLGLAFGGVLVALMLGVNAFPDVQQTFVEAWGPDVGGVPIAWVVSGVELVFVAPAVLVAGEALFALTQGLPAHGRSAPTGAGGLAVVMLGQVPEALRTPQRRLRISGLYLLLLGLGWIAWAAAKGI